MGLKLRRDNSYIGLLDEQSEIIKARQVSRETDLRNDIKGHFSIGRRDQLPAHKRRQEYKQTNSQQYNKHVSANMQHHEEAK